jgi:hypothetical protein
MVTITPTPGRQGAARITITVQDADGNTALGTFQVAVGVPSLSPIPEQVTAQDTATPPIPFSIADAEFDSLLLGIVSTNETLLPTERIRFGGAGSSRTLTLDPTPGLTGLTEITLFVSDGFNTVSNRFRLTVYPRRGLLLSDDFNYADGSLITNSQFTWRTYGASAGDTGQTQVIEGRLMLQSDQSEDLQAALSQGPYAPTNSWVLYASFALTCSSRPSGSGDYFAHFRGRHERFWCTRFRSGNRRGPRANIASAWPTMTAARPQFCPSICSSTQPKSWWCDSTPPPAKVFSG